MRIPIATYRLQFNEQFDFNSAAGVISYLSDLNMTDIYASPIFKARKGSQHGYDIIDPNQINPELGSAETFERLADEINLNQMGWVQDIVPNHTAFDPDNALLMDVLENGMASDYAGFFDILWNHPCRDLNQKVLAPFAGGHFGDELEKGLIRLIYGPNGFSVHYHKFIFPVSIESYGMILKPIREACESRIPADHPDMIRLRNASVHIASLSLSPFIKLRRRQCHYIKKTLWNIYNRNPVIRSIIDTGVDRFNGSQDSPESYSGLDELLGSQRFRLSYWKTAADEINYRRFFSINELICWRTEKEEVFNHVHKLVLQLIESGRISGLRIDHIDGLYDPEAYLKHLAERVGDRFIVVEKILGATEKLPLSWPVQGTTGYDFLGHVNSIFCRTDTAPEFTRIYQEFTGNITPWPDLVHQSKKRFMEEEMAGDLDNISFLLKNIAAGYRHGKDFTFHRLRSALRELLTCFPVYRTFISARGCSPIDRDHLQSAAATAIENRPGLRRELEFILAMMVSGLKGFHDPTEKCLTFVMKFQQMMAPVMAKGLEDTAFYQYNRLLSLNDVGTAPARFGSNPDLFHDAMRHRADQWPHCLNATATHDTKRGEDVRSRLNVLSEIPHEWESTLKIWSGLNRDKKIIKNGVPAPDPNEEYYLYQTLIGSFPFDGSHPSTFAHRIKAHMVKSLREAKVHSSWFDPDLSYESACTEFIDRLLTDRPGNGFMKHFHPFFRKVAGYGIWNSLSQVLIKITAPGIPDFYQGTELWDLNLTDPDNRRPVDFKARKACLRAIREKERTDIASLLTDLLTSRENGEIKCFLTVKALEARRKHHTTFQSRSYMPLYASGTLKDHIIAYIRVWEDQWCMTIAPRFFTFLIKEAQHPLGRKVWHDTQIMLPPEAPSRWINVLTGEPVRLHERFFIGDILDRFPVAMMAGERE